jgi:hypothetical protein
VHYFKGDDTEQKMFLAAEPILKNIMLSLVQAYEEIYVSYPLGQFIYDEKRVPLTNAIRREVFEYSFMKIFEAWAFSGTFESYLTVFKKIFGEDSVIEFTVPGPGKLNIDIEASGVAISPLIAREVIDNAYVLDNIVDDTGDNICVQSVFGIETESELQKMLFSMVPNGIYTEVSLTIGS